MKFIKLMTFLVFLNPMIGNSKILYYGSETEMISIVSGQTTILRFNEEVKTISQATQFIIEPADLADPNYQVLTIKPRSENSTDKITFILSNDSIINIKVKTVPQNQPDKTDNFYDLRPKDLEIEKGTNVSEIELMKAMIRSDNIVGFHNKSLNKIIPSGEKEVKSKLLKVYTGSQFNGYIFQIENTSEEKRVAIDLKSLTFGKPNVALLSQCDHKIIPEKGTTILRIVTKATSTYYEVTLPITPMGKKQGDTDEI